MDGFSLVEGYTFPDPNTLTFLEFTMPMKVVSEANTYEPGYMKRARKRAQQLEVWAELHNKLRNKPFKIPCVVNLTRIGPKALDTDNLQSAFKGVRDAVAKKLGVDDGEDDKIRFTYDQEPCGKRVYSVKVIIKSCHAQIEQPVLETR